MSLNRSHCYSEDQVIMSCVIAILPTILILISGLSLTIAFSGIEAAFKDTVIIWFSTTVSMSLIPMYLLNRYRKTTWEGIGLIFKLSAIEWIGLVLMGLITAILAVMNHSETTIVILALQTLAVAINEEIWIRGILLTHLRQIRVPPVWAILITGIVFGFITHLNEPFMDNLLWRFPGGLLLGYIALKTNRLSIPIMLHYLNNVIGLT